MYVHLKLGKRKESPFYQKKIKKKKKGLTEESTAAAM